MRRVRIPYDPMTVTRAGCCLPRLQSAVQPGEGPTGPLTIGARVCITPSNTSCQAARLCTVVQPSLYLSTKVTPRCQRPPQHQSTTASSGQQRHLLSIRCTTCDAYAKVSLHRSTKATSMPAVGSTSWCKRAFTGLAASHHVRPASCPSSGQASLKPKAHSCSCLPFHPSTDAPNITNEQSASNHVIFPWQQTDIPTYGAGQTRRGMHRASQAQAPVHKQHGFSSHNL